MVKFLVCSVHCPVCSVQFAVNVAMLTVVLEWLRPLHQAYVLQSESSMSDAKDDWQLILNLMNPPESLLWLILQYWSCMLTCPASCTRLCLVFSLRGCHSYLEWQDTYPDDIVTLQRCIHAAAASSERRQLVHLLRYFGIFRVGDLR